MNETNESDELRYLKSVNYIKGVLFDVSKPGVDLSAVAANIMALAQGDYSSWNEWQKVVLGEITDVCDETYAPRMIVKVSIRIAGFLKPRM